MRMDDYYNISMKARKLSTTKTYRSGGGCGGVEEVEVVALSKEAVVEIFHCGRLQPVDANGLPSRLSFRMLLKISKLMLSRSIPQF